MTMASNRHNLLEEARPPERTAMSSESPGSFTGLIQNEEVPILESLQNMATCSRKSQSCRSSLMRPEIPKTTSSRRPVSLTEAGQDRTTMWRNSYHKDVEEALSSLLWEPYECRETQTVSSNYWDATTNSLSSDISSPLSSTSSSCNSLCDGRMECCAAYRQTGKKFPESFTNDFIGCDYYRNGNCVKNVPGSCGETTSRSDPCLEYGKRSRPSLPTSFTDDFDGEIPQSTERNSGLALVSNLPRVEGSWPSQSPMWTRSRDAERELSDVDASQNVFDARPLTSSQFSECRRATRHDTRPNSSAFTNYYNSLRSASFSEIRTPSDDGPLTTMRLSIPPNPITAPLVPNRVSLTTTPASIQVQTSTETRNNPRTISRPISATSQTISVTTPPRIQVPNVIPNHSRSNSQTGNRVQVPLVPNHNRNSSGLSLQSQPTNRIQLAVNHSRNNSNSNSQQNSVRNSVPVFTQNIIHTRVPSLPGNLNASVAAPANTNPGGTSVNVVNCYRAVPVNVVSSVPTIKCLNSVVEPTTNVDNQGIGSRSENVSNVQIVQTVQAVTTPVITPSVVQPQTTTGEDIAPVPVPRTRTFTSTEAQTDDTIVGRIENQNQTPIVTNLQREHRRRERRDRRHQQRLANSGHPHAGITQSQWTVTPGEGTPGVDRLPDLLNSHLPPPYSTMPSSNAQVPAPILPVGVANTIGMPASLIPPPSQMVQFTSTTGPFTQMPLVQGTPTAVPVPMVPVPTSNGGLRFLQFQNAVGMRRSRRGGQTYNGEDPPKSCCGVLLTQTVSIRWFIVMIAFVGVCCVVVGTILGAMKASGREHLTVSLLMIGVGIILVTVSGVAWRLTSHDAPTCRAMLGLSGSDDGTGGDNCARRFVPRLPPSYGRPHHPYAAMMYPEFQYRPPPPSYQASMQEYRLRLLLLDRHAPVLSPSGTQQHSVTPPPTYRSQSGSLLRAPLSNRRDPSQSEYSCPPSYRSRTSSNRPVLDPNGPTNTGLPDHSREHSLSLSDSNGSVVNVVSILTNQVVEDNIETISLDNVKVVPESDIGPLKMMLKSDNNLDKADVTKDGNLVTIVQTSGEQSPVIVTVSGSQMSTNVTPNSSNFNNNEVNSEMEILAHL